MYGHIVSLCAPPPGAAAHAGALSSACDVCAFLVLRVGIETHLNLWVADLVENPQLRYEM